jgi:hypothetical protein
MNLKEAQVLSKFHRPGGGKAASRDPQILKAVRLVEADPALKTALAAQVEFDASQARLLDSIKPGEAFLSRIDETLEHLQKGFQWSALRHPAFLAGAIAVLVVIGVLIFEWRDMQENFPGRDSMEKMVDTIDRMGGKGLDAKTVQAGDLQDWFFNKGYEDFRILPEFAAMNTAGCRLFKQEGHPVAQIALAGHNAYLNIFHLGDFDVQLDPPERWRVFEQGDWAVAARADSSTGYMVMFKGKKSDMQVFLDGLK